MTSVAHLPVHDSTSLDDLLVQYSLSRDLVLRDRIVEENLWLATRMARRFADRGEPLDDLVQVARIGLLHAIERYGPHRGVPFGAFATPTILGELRRHFRDHTWSVHVPRHAKELRLAVNTVTETFAREFASAPRVIDIASLLNVSAEAVVEALAANSSYRPVSLDDAAFERSAPAVAEAAFDDVLDRDLVIQLFGGLSSRQRTVLYLRYFEDMSQQQIAVLIGTSQVHVGRLLTSSLGQLRRKVDLDRAGACIGIRAP